MSIVGSLVNTQLRQAEADMRAGTPDDLVTHAQDYLVLLDEYVDRLRNLKGIPRVADAGQSRFARELVENMRGAVRTAIEGAVSERNRIESLILSFTMVTGWSAVETLNRFGYRKTRDWVLTGTRVRTVAGEMNISVTAAVLQAKRLRREAYFDPPKAE